MSHPPPAIVIGNRFFIQNLANDLLGHGGMGDVYRGFDQQTQTEVAIKALRPYVIVEADTLARFLREGETLRRLNHPNIVKILAAAEQDNIHYIIMEYVPGGSLRHLLEKKGGLPIEQVLQISLELADALTRAHHLNIIHRDLKPDNVLMAQDGTPRLTDFGIALDRAVARLTRSGMILGTIPYLSPEACQEASLDARADIWSFGVMLYEMLCGQLPFQSDTLAGIILSILNQPLPDMRRYRANLPPALISLLQRMLMKDRHQRINTIRQVAAELEMILQQTLTNGPSDTGVMTALAHSPLPISETEAVSAPLKPKRVFLSYTQREPRDRMVAQQLQQSLQAQGHIVFIDSSIRAGTNWLQEVDEHIQQSDFLVVLLSPTSANSEMVQAEVRRAYEYRRLNARPQIIPVRIAYAGPLPYMIDFFLNPLQYVIWQREEDSERVTEEILMAMKGKLQPQPATAIGQAVFSEDGGWQAHPSTWPQPLPQFDPRFLDELVAPGGAVQLSDRFYVERSSDNALRRQMRRTGTTTTIRAPRQSGKSSLLVRGIHQAREQGAKVIHLDMQRVDQDTLQSADSCLRYVGEFILRKLRLDTGLLSQMWQGSLGPQDKLTYLLEDVVLPGLNAPLILALDEADRLLDTSFHSDFFALLRSWHNNRAVDDLWLQLSLILVISTEPYLLIADTSQSPFNVGLKLYLEDFSSEQVADLNQRHGNPISSRELEQFMTLLGGHPYLTRKAFYTLVTEKMSWSELQHAATRDNGPFGDHLRRYHWLLRHEPELQGALRQVIQQNQCTSEMAFFRLLRAGLVKGQGDVAQCRCDLYRLYFAQKLNR